MSNKRVKLFCFPYAGGSAATFGKWKQYLDTRIELVPIELAGRGRRIHEPLYNDVQEVIEDIYALIQRDILQGPYAFFGHSMGSMICYELTQKIRSNGMPEPIHIFFSGRGAPHVHRTDEKKYHLLNDKEFKREVIQLGGTPPEFFEYPELVELLLPLLKNDFKLAETDLHRREILPLDQSITVFFGKDEDMTAGQCDGWKWHTCQQCEIHYFNGGHFFVHDALEDLIRIINHVMINKMEGSVKLK